MIDPQGPNLGDDHRRKDYTGQDKVSPRLRQEQTRALDALQLAHTYGAPAIEIRRLTEWFLRLAWIQDLAEAEAMGLEDRVDLLERRIRDLYPRRRRRAA